MLDAHEVYTANVVRQALISLCVLIMSMVIFSVHQTWRDRKEPLPARKTPASVILMFICGYVALLGLAAYRSYELLDTYQLSPGAYLTVVALFVNAVSMAMLVYYRRDEGTPSIAELRSTDDGVLGSVLRLRIFSRAQQVERYEEKYGARAAVPARRAEDRQTPRELIEETKQAIDTGLI